MSRRGLWALCLLALTVLLAAIAEVPVWSEEIFGPSPFLVPSAARVSMATTTWASAVGTVVAGVLAVAFGARRTAIVAVLTAGLGIELARIGGVHGGSLVIAVALGLLRPCPIAAAVAIVAEQPLGRLRFHACAAAALAFGFAGDVGSFVGTWVFEDRHGNVVGELALVAYIVAAAPLVLAGRLRERERDVAPVHDAPYRAPSRPVDTPADPAPSPRRAQGAAFVLVFVVLLLMNLCAYVELRTFGLSGALWGIVPALRFLGFGAVLFAFARAVIRAEPWPPLAVLSGALIAIGVSLALTPWAARKGDGIDVILFALVAPTTGLARSILWSIAAAYAALSVAPRSATAALAAVLVAATLASWGLTLVLVLATVRESWLLFACAAVAVVAGVLVRRRRHDLQRSLAEPEIGPTNDP